MKHKIIIAVLLGLIATSAVAEEQTVVAQKQLGVGVIVGEPTGLSVKYWLDENQAIDGALAWSFWDENGLQIHADYLWHNFDLLHVGETSGQLPVYYGVGGRLKFKEDEGKGDHDHETVLSVRAPVGISYMFGRAPLEVFGEIVPVLDLTPDVELDLNVAVGLRFYIK